MVRVHQHKVCDALHQHLRFRGRVRGRASLGGKHLGGGQCCDECQLPQHLLCRADLCKGLALHKAADAHGIQLCGDLRCGELCSRLPVTFRPDGFVQRPGCFCLCQRRKIGVLQKCMQGRAHLGGGQSVFGEEARPIQRGLLRLVHDAGHADLGRHPGKVCRRVLPGKARPQLCHKGRVRGRRGLRFQLLRLLFLFRLRCFRQGDDHRAAGVRKGQLQIPCQSPQRPAAGMHQQRRPQPVGKAVCLPVQGGTRPRRQKRRRFGKGVRGLADAQRHREDEPVLCAGQGHIQKAHLLAAQLLPVHLGQRGVGRRFIGALALFRPQPQTCPVFPAAGYRPR